MYPGKRIYVLANFINAIKTKKRSIIYGNDYVVLSRDIYDELINKVYPKKHQQIEFSRDGNDWLKEYYK